jgi:hypothetical protein
MSHSAVTTLTIHSPPQYLPPESSMQDTRPLLLEYLQKPETLLYTEDQARIFLSAKRALNHAELGLGLCGYAFVILVPTVLTLFAVQLIPSNSKNVLAMTVLTVIISSVASMILTGSLPHRSSNNQNIDQNVMGELKYRFDNFGKYLLIHYKNPLTRESIRQGALNILELLEVKEKNLTDITTQKMEGPDATRFLHDTLIYIQTNHASYNSELEICLETLSLTSQANPITAQTSL